MNYYDDERKIIEYFQLIRKYEVFFPCRSRNAIKIFKSIHSTKRWENWVYSAGKADPPPDFFSEKYQIMMEVMRVDDHAFTNEKGVLINPVNMLESKIQREIRDKIKEKCPNTDLNAFDIIVNAVTNLPSNQDHNYQFYFSSFQRALEKHINKIPLYRQNHPNKKTVFFIFDESTAYVQIDDADFVKRGPIAMEPYFGIPVWHFMDSRFINVFKKSDIDYLIWYAPYKVFHGSPIQPPRACVFDVKNYDYNLTIEYPEERIISSEA